MPMRRYALTTGAMTFVSRVMRVRGAGNRVAVVVRDRRQHGLAAGLQPAE